MSKRASPHKPAEPRAPAPAPEPTKLDLSKIRHDLRTPINHILGYCEMLQEEAQVPESFTGDLQKIHAGGRQLLALIMEYFDEETFEAKRPDLHRLCHELRTPVNHIVGYSELLQEQAEDLGKKKLMSDLQRICDAAQTFLSLMEEYLVTPHAAAQAADTSLAPVAAPPTFLQPGIGFAAPAPRSAVVSRSDRGHLLVVDDDEVNREMLARRLRRQGYTVALASQGLEALRLVRAEPFDLILLDMVMPGLDGYQVLTRIKSDSSLCDIPVIMLSALDQEHGIARCIEAGSDDYVAKPFNPVLLRARIAACLEKKRLHDQERRTHQALVQSQQRLAAELAEAAAYVRSLLPAPVEQPVAARWCFQPSIHLGGDAFGYHWVDDRHLVIYLLDVCGHGVGAALLSVSVLNVLRSHALPGADFLDPAAVLSQLNATFRMEQQHNMFFTVWYGVYDRTARRLAYASGGHPPALLLAKDQASGTRPIRLATSGPAIGCLDAAAYTAAACLVDPGARLWVLSDGVFEIARTDGKMWSLEAFERHLLPGTTPTIEQPEDGLELARQLRGSRALDDDFSLLRLSFA